MKNKIDNTSYFKIYIYLLVLLICLVLYLFVFSKANTTKSVLMHNETSTVAASAPSNAKTTKPVIETKTTTPAVVDNKTTANTNTNTDNTSTVKSNDSTETNASNDTNKPVSTTTDNTPATTTNNVNNASNNASSNNDTDNENGKFLPINSDNVDYQSLPIQKIVVTHGRTFFGVLKDHGYSTGDLYSLYPENKRLLDSVHAGDTVYIKTKNGRIVVLSVVKGGEYKGQYIYNETAKKYKFVK